MKVQIWLDTSEEDLRVEGWLRGKRTATCASSELGFLRISSGETFYADLQALEKTAGVHRIVYKNYHRALATRFPFALYYSVSGQTAFVRAIVDCRRDPTWISEHLR